MNDMSDMNVKRNRLAVWTLMAALLLFMLPAAGPAYAATAQDGSLNPSSTAGLNITGYTVLKNGSPNNNPIYTNEVITLVLNVFDERIIGGTDFSFQPAASLNTESFTIPSQSNIEYSIPDPPTAGASYSITFKDIKYTGKGKTFSCFISYEDVTGAGSPPPPDTYPKLPIPMEKVTITLDQCVIYVPDTTPPPPPPEINIKGTGFVLKEAYYGDGAPIYAGNAFTLSVTILATNGTSAVENVSVSFSPPEQLTFADGSSVIYIGTMAPGASVPVSTTLLPGGNIQEGSYTVGIDVNGVNQQTGSPVSVHMTITLPILQPERFEIFNTYLPSDLVAGMDSGMGYGSVTLVNQGRGAVANVSFEITGEGLRLEEGRMYIGNVGGGEQRSADFNLLGDIPGVINALVVVTYENVRGEKKKLEHAFTVNVMDMGGGYVDPGWPERPDFEYPGYAEKPGGLGGIPIWLWIVIGAAAAAVVIILLVRRNKKKKKAAEAALDDIEDEE